jgi:hypothetical protein
MSLETYYLIVENTLDVIPIGEFHSLPEATVYAQCNSDHLTHGEGYITVSESQLARLGQKIILFKYEPDNRIL